MNNTISNFYTTIQAKIKATSEVRNQYGKILSPDFNFFDFWSLDENKVSEIIAHFLDVKGAHNQGDVFLKLFIEHFKLDFEYTNDDLISVKCEHITHNNRRIDIVITKNQFEKIIGIENKIYNWTSDQENQVMDYLNYLNKVTNDNYCLLYLSPKDKIISETSITKQDIENYTNANRLKVINYEEDIIELIHLFALHCESDRVRYFLLEFEKQLKEMFTGENYMDESKMITDYILENDANLETSLRIGMSLHQVKTKLKEDFEKQLHEIGNELGITYQNNRFYPSQWSNNFICFSYESGGILYGIIRKESDANKSRIIEIEEAFNVKFNTSNWWPMWQFFYSNIDNTPEFWLEINNGVAKQKAKEFVEVIINKFNIEKY